MFSKKVMLVVGIVFVLLLYSSMASGFIFKRNTTVNVTNDSLIDVNISHMEPMSSHMEGNQNEGNVQEEGSTNSCDVGSDIKNQIFEEFGVSVNDNCMLNERQLEIIYDVLSLFPDTGIKSICIVSPCFGQDPKIVIPVIPVGEEYVDLINDNVDNGADHFTLQLINRLSNSYWENKMSPDLKHKLKEILERSGKNEDNQVLYISDDLYNDYMSDPSKFFSDLSTAWYQNTYAFFNRMLNTNSKNIADQFTFLLNLFSDNEKSFFYVTDTNGNIAYEDIPVSESGNEENVTVNGEIYVFNFKNGFVDSFGKYVEVSSSGNETTGEGGGHEGGEHENETGGSENEGGLPGGGYGVAECSDGTYYGHCSQIKPYFCDNGTLKENCSLCGCFSGFKCIESGSCEEIKRCDDGTISGRCSEQKPYFCKDGEFVENCSLCGCPSGYECLSDGTCYINHKPEIYQIGDINVKGWKEVYLSFNESEEIKFKVKARDPDGDEITYDITGNPPGSTFNRETGLFLWTPGYNVGGRQYSMTVFAVDNPVSGSPKADEKMIRIYIGNVNRPPILMVNESYKVDENVLLKFKVKARDPDGDEITYFAGDLPNGSTFNERTGEFEWIPEFGQSGNYKVWFSVSDGKDTVTKYVLITVGDVDRPPKAKITFPLLHSVFNANSIVHFSGADSKDPDGDELLFIWDFGDGETLTTKSPRVEHVYLKPGNYTVFLNVTDGKLIDSDNTSIEIKQTELKDSDNDGVPDVKDKCPDTPSYMKINIYGCPLPKYSKFKNNLTTDFEKIDVTNATDVVIAVPEKVKIEFRKNRLNLAGKDLDRLIEVKNNTIEIKTEYAPDLNKSAVITFYNVNFTDPIILRNGVYCEDCEILSYVNHTLTFMVPHFTSYTLMEWASYSGYCGDGLCSMYESCHDCEVDCGKCKEKTLNAPAECHEMWICTPWSDCNELNLRTRKCKDVNMCGTNKKRPKEVMECGKGGLDLPSLTLFGTTIFLLSLMYVAAEEYKKRKELRNLTMLEIKKFIRGYMYRGYTKKEIKRLLLEKGYEEKEIDEMIKEVEKEIF